MDMSPLAEDFKKHPPVEVPVDPKTPRRFKDFVRKRDLSETEVFGGDASSSLNPDLVAKAGGLYGDECDEESLPLGDSMEVDSSSKPEKPAASAASHVDDTDLFHAQEFVSRQEQHKERDILVAEQKKKQPEEVEAEEGVPSAATEKTEKKRQAKAKAKAKATEQKKQTKALKAAAKATEKAKKKLEKELIKEKKKTEKAKASKAKASKKKESKKKWGGKRKAETEGAMEEEDPAPEVTPPEFSQPEVVEADAQKGGVLEAANHAEDGNSPSNASRAAVVGEDDQKDQGKKTFARRFRPTRSKPAARFDAIRNMFEKHLASQLKKSLSTMEVHL